MAKMDDRTFDELLKKAFTKQYENEIKTEPADEEMARQYPLTQKQLRDAGRILKRKSKPTWLRYAQRAAVIALCVISVGFAVLMTDPGIRGSVGGTVTQWIDDMVAIDFGKSPEYERIDITKTSVGYIPKGFEVIEDRSEDGFISQTYYSAATDEYIFIDIRESSDIALFTEDAMHEFTKTQIKGYDAYITYSDSQRQGTVCFGNQYFTVAVSGMTDKDELIKTAENIALKD